MRNGDDTVTFRSRGFLYFCLLIAVMTPAGLFLGKLIADWAGAGTGARMWAEGGAAAGCAGIAAGIGRAVFFRANRKDRDSSTGNGPDEQSHAR
jgi:hypothetical protein